MAQHGYIGDGWGARGDHGDEDFVRDWYGDDRRGRERGGAMAPGRGGEQSRWRDQDQDRERSRWGDWDGGRGREWSEDRRGNDDDRGLFERARSWFADDEDDNRRQPRGRGMSAYGREHGFGGLQGDYRGGSRQGGFGSAEDLRGGRRRFSSHPDDHYRSWRDKQIEALDRDYQDYCREREQKFHQEFDSWRQGRQSRQPGQSATTSGESMSGRGESAGSDELTLESSDRVAGEGRSNRGGRAPR